MELTAYRTNLGLFVKKFVSYSTSYTSTKINGVLASTYQEANGWLFLEGVQQITSFETLKKGADKHIGYILKISSIANDEIPLELSREQVGEYYDDDLEENRWTSYSDYQALYKPVHVKTEDVWTPEEVKLTILRDIHIDNYDSPVKMSIGTQVRQQEPAWQSSDDLSKIVLYEDIERILTPEFLLHERPCQLAPGQVYSIVRNWIKMNINPKAAFISSDYDFCFTVKRRISIKPVVLKTEIKKQNGRSYATPKFNTKQVGSKDEILFEMAPKAYNGYTVIEHWHASSLKDMAEQLKGYLESLMEVINAEAVECPHCNGCGAIVSKINTNERNI